MDKNVEVPVPDSLRAWFVIHFVLDFLSAVPLIIAPALILSFLGWSTIDPVSTRLVGAALMGIGVESLLGRNGSVETYRAMLNLKIIWSGSAVFGLVLSLVGGGPVMGWVLLGILAPFCALWTYYRIRLR